MATECSADTSASPDDMDEIPAQCERNGCEFGGAAVKVGARWVCTACEEDEYTGLAINEQIEREFDELAAADIDFDQDAW